jgi:hypothetical protein
MVAGELDRELRDRFSGEGLVTEFEETLHTSEAVREV